MKRIVLIVGLFTLAACCANSSSYITYYLKKGFDGRPVNQFFAQYGYPAGMFGLTNGGKVYRWVSTQYGIAPAQAAPADYMSYRGTYQIVDTYRGSTERTYCEIRIYTDASDTIRDFALAVDSTGKWSTSRCSEIFNETYP